LDVKLLAQIDKQLVATFSALFASILLFCNNKVGLLLSDSGSYVAGYVRAPAGTKRLSNLLRSEKWDASLIDAFFFNRAQQRVNQLIGAPKRPCCCGMIVSWKSSKAGLWRGFARSKVVEANVSPR
jgi:pimeloyl-CoA synthetase